MLRSLLFVPAKEKMMNKISSLSSDGYIIDLEDSINEGEKAEALELLCSLLSEHSEWSDIFIRLNKTHFEEEAIALNGFNVGFMLPKFESPEEYARIDRVWSKHKLIALVETPMGVINIQQIAQCSWVDAIAFGAEDYTASVNMLNDDVMLSPIKSTLVLYAKAYKKKVFDTPSFKINDDVEFEHEVRNSMNLGFDGKLAISPRHLQYINDTFNSCDLDYMKSVIAKYEDDGNAVVVIDGNVYEKMHINRIRKIIKENS